MITKSTVLPAIERNAIRRTRNARVLTAVLAPLSLTVFVLGLWTLTRAQYGWAGVLLTVGAVGLGWTCWRLSDAGPKDA